jgi:hypothetical protein
VRGLTSSTKPAAVVTATTHPQRAVPVTQLCKRRARLQQLRINRQHAGAAIAHCFAAAFHCTRTERTGAGSRRGPLWRDGMEARRGAGCSLLAIVGSRGSSSFTVVHPVTFSLSPASGCSDASVAPPSPDDGAVLRARVAAADAATVLPRTRPPAPALLPTEPRTRPPVGATVALSPGPDALAVPSPPPPLPPLPPPPTSPLSLAATDAASVSPCAVDATASTLGRMPTLVRCASSPDCAVGAATWPCDLNRACAHTIPTRILSRQAAAGTVTQRVATNAAACVPSACSVTGERCDGHAREAAAC